MGICSSVEKSFIVSNISKNIVVIFSSTKSQHSKIAKKILKQVGAKYKQIELNEMENGLKILEKLGEMTDHATLPRVFIKGKCIGGAQELADLHKSGELKVLLKNLNALRSESDKKLEDEKKEEENDNHIETAEVRRDSAISTN